MSETKRVELGDVFYVFTNWGICKGRVVKIIDECLNKDEIATKTMNDPGYQIVGVSQYKLNIDVDKDNLNRKYGFFYVRHQLFEQMIDALKYETARWGMGELLK